MNAIFKKMIKERYIQICMHVHEIKERSIVPGLILNECI